MPGKRTKNDDEDSVISERFQPLKTVASLMGEGEKFCRDQLFTKAIECYSEALEMEEGNKIALVERAACYLKLGKNSLALADAEESLKENKKFTKGLYEKAEALYAMGEFELALVFYHRGKKLRSDVKEFQLGINKAQEAIDNCVGDPHSVKLEVKGDLSYFNKPDESKNKKKIFKLGNFQKYGKQQTVQKREKRVAKPGTQKTVKQLLGELYADKVYLEKLLSDDHITALNTKSGDAIWSLANNGLDFLDSRTDFWRQQKPIYARKSVYANQSDDQANMNALNYILKRLEIIDNLQSNGKLKETLAKSNKLLEYVNPLNQRQLRNVRKKEIIATILSNKGNAYLEMGLYEQALESHQKDLEMSQEFDNNEGISRAYENIGRVYARNGKYQQAIEVWEKKLPLAETDMEKAWLYHEIGRCHLELEQPEKSEDYGHKSLECAKKIDDEVWQLNATVLIAQSDVKKGTVSSLTSAVENFEKALKMTEKQNDNTAGNAIVKALSDCKQKLEKLSSISDGDASPTQREASAAAAKSPVNAEPKEKIPSPEPVQKSPTPEPEQVQKSPTPEPVQKSPTPEPEERSYRVEVKTADDPGSGTDANVSITLIGSKGNLEDQPLKKSSTNEDPFENSHLDVFTIKSTTNIGNILRIRVSHDGKGFGSGFMMEYIQINFNDVTFKFNVDKKLEVDDDDNCMMELTPDDERPDKSSNYD